MAYFPKQYTITASAASLTSILGAKHYIKFLSVRNATGATAALYLGKSDVTNAPANAGAQIAAGEVYYKHEGGTQGSFSTDEVFLVGTVNAANIAFITVIE